MTCQQFVSLSDIRYAARLRVMAESLWEWHPEARIAVLCLDEGIIEFIDAWGDSRISTITVDELTEKDPRLDTLRTERPPREFYSTIKPLAVHLVAESLPDGEMLCFIDADTCFYSSPDPVFEEMTGHSIGISPHRFSDDLIEMEKFGKFNAGFMTWRMDEKGRRCIWQWHEACFDWCHNRAEDGRFMNQGYLTQWPQEHEGVIILQHPGANLAPWNLDAHDIHLDKQQGIMVDSTPLIFFHFSHLVRGRWNRWEIIHYWPGLEQKMPRKALFGSYLDKLKKAESKMSRAHRKAALNALNSSNISPKTIVLRKWCRQSRD